MSESVQEPAPSEPVSDVFARLADTPLELIDKLIEVTESTYTDLNKVRDNAYWGDLVFHQGAALRSLKQARAELDDFSSQALGARNTEIGVSVVTAVIDGNRHYAEKTEDKAALVDGMLAPDDPATACHLYVWDRPYDGQRAGPYQQIRVVTAAVEQLGVLNYTEESEDGELQSWHTYSATPSADAPQLRFDRASALTFPRNSLLPTEQLRAALNEFVRTAALPEAVAWQQARWSD